MMAAGLYASQAVEFVLERTGPITREKIDVKQLEHKLWMGAT